MQSTLFSYRCERCSGVGPLETRDKIAVCTRCDASTSLLDGAVLSFFDQKTEQNAYFDKIYAEDTDQHDYFIKIYGSALIVDATESKKEYTIYGSLAQQAKTFAELSGRSIENDFVNINILEVACGSGWLTGNLLKMPSVLDCKFHAFDISPGGPKMLRRFAEYVGRADALELSVQDACDMRFADATFDLVLGNSILHHFNDINDHLVECFRVMRPGAAALFGEPFAMGHVIVASALKAASAVTGRNSPAINAYYGNMKFKVQNNNDSQALGHLVDKHIFMRETLIDACRKVGFRDVSIKPRHDFEFFRRGLAVDVALRKIGVQDEEIAREARRIYITTADMFSDRTFAFALPNFMDVILYK